MNKSTLINKILAPKLNENMHIYVHVRAIS